MIRLGVIGDTHRQLGIAKKAVEQMGEIDALLHTGDHFQDAHDLAQQLPMPVEGVAGNCDWFKIQGPNELTLEYDGVRVFLTHGHLYRVRFDTEVLLKKALAVEAQVAVFGHTHIPFMEQRKGILLFNPGSVANPREGTRPSFGILNIAEGKVTGKIIPLGN